MSTRNKTNDTTAQYEIVKISETIIEGKIIDTVDPRELHAFLGVKTAFTHWFQRRIEEYGFSSNSDYWYLPNLANTKQSHSPVTVIEYQISLDMAKELSMVEKTERGKQARRYFIDREKRYNDLVALFIGERRPKDKRYTLFFFQEVSRVYGKREPVNDKHSPMMQGFIDRYVYKLLPQEVRDHYNVINPKMNGRRKFPLHQLLTIEMDHKFLKERLDLILKYCDGCGYGDSHTFKYLINNHDRKHRMKIGLSRARQLVLTPFDTAQLLLLPEAS